MIKGGLDMMKKLISVFLMFVMLVASLSAFAAEETALGEFPGDTTYKGKSRAYYRNDDRRGYALGFNRAYT